MASIPDPLPLSRLFAGADRAALAAIARDELARQAAILQARRAFDRRDRVELVWGAIADWLEARIFPADPAAALAAARAIVTQVRSAWARAADQTAAHPQARHWTGLLAIERLLERDLRV